MSSATRTTDVSSDVDVIFTRVLNAKPSISGRSAGLEVELVRYIDGCQLYVGGEALAGCDGGWMSCTVPTASTLRALGSALLSLADEADRRGLFDGIDAVASTAS